MGPSINYVVSVGRGGQKSPILFSKKTTKRGEGVRNRRFWDDIVYGQPFIVLLYNACPGQAERSERVEYIRFKPRTSSLRTIIFVCVSCISRR